MKNRLTLKIVLLLISTDVLETAMEFCFKKTALAETNFQILSPADAFTFIKNVAFAGPLWLGFAAGIIALIIWSTVLSKIDLSLAVPIASSSYILVPIVSIIFLREHVPLLRWAGILFILLGVILVSKSSQKDHSVLE